MSDINVVLDAGQQRVGDTAEGISTEGAMIFGGAEWVL
jgi:hypothetical protein